MRAAHRNGHRRASAFPGCHHPSVDSDIFLTRQETHEKFQHILELSRRFPINSTPMYLEFAAGQRDYGRSPWSTVTFTPNGCEGPCYSIGERYVHDWEELWNTTDWAYWESRQDARCRDCAMHSGFEASALRELKRNPKDLPRTVACNLMG